MRRKCLLGAAAIVLAALAILIVAGCFQRKKTLKGIQELCFYEGNRYCIDREKNFFRILRMDSQGKCADMIRCPRFGEEGYHRLQQLFFDGQGEAYVLQEEIKASSLKTWRSRIFHCDFDRGRLVETAYDLTESSQEGSCVYVQRIQDGKVYYIQVVETEEDMGKAHVCAMDRQGRVERLDTVSLKHPFLKSQFFLSQDQALLWMDYSGQTFVKELGSGAKLEIEGITGVENRFLNLSSDGKRKGYVFDSQTECVWRIDLKAMAAEILPSQEAAEGQASDPAFWEWMSKEGSVTLSFGALLGRLLPLMGALFVAGALLWALWYIYCRYQVQTILARLALVFMLGLLFADHALERWLGQTIQAQLDRNQALTLAVMGEQQREHITGQLEENRKQFPLGGQDWALSRRRLEESQKAGDVNETLPYAYTILEGGKDGQLRIGESMWEYTGILAQYHYDGQTFEIVNQCYESEKPASHKQQKQNGTFHTRFLPLVLSDGGVYGVLAVSSATDFLDYRIWQYQQNLRFVSLGLLLVLSVVLLVVLALFLMPLRSLKKSAKQLAKGELGVTVPVHGHDEIADISRAFNQMSLGIARQVEDIRSMSDGYYRFIPAKILELLGKESIQQVKLGDETTVHMTVLSMYALNYPKQGRMRPPQEVYREINEVLAVLEAPIAEHGGVVEHFEDNGLSAFFTENSGQALKAAIEAHRSLDALGYGEHRAIAITYGRIMTGVIGYEGRMEVSTISVHSDLAKALRLKGNDYGARILLTHPAYQQIPDFEGQYHARYLGIISISGALEGIYDVYDGDREEDFYYKELTKPLFEHGVELFLAKKFYEARLAFVEVLKQYRKDQAAKEYLYRCDKYYKEPEGKAVETELGRF